jgi:hypothetical protein
MRGELKKLTKEFFAILDAVETSEEGREFHPTHISCCRALTVIKVNKILERMKELSK